MLHIKDWKMNEIKRNFNGGYLEEINGIVRETEKAVCMSIVWGYTSNLTRTENVWVPKSALMTDEEYAAENAAAQKRYDDGCDRYQKIVDFCKANGVKGARTGLKTATLMQKIKEAGLVYEA